MAPTTRPLLSVFDPDARVPLTLTRDGLARPFPLHDELIAGVVDDLLAFALVHAPTRRGSLWPDPALLPAYPGVEARRWSLRHNPSWREWLVVEHGATLLTRRRLARAEVRSLVVAFGVRPARAVVSLRAAGLATQQTSGLHAWREERAEGAVSAATLPAGLTHDVAGVLVAPGTVRGVRLVLSRHAAEEAAEAFYGPLTGAALHVAGGVTRAGFRVEPVGKGVVFDWGECPEGALNPGPVLAYEEGELAVPLAEWWLDPAALLAAAPPTPLDARWEELFDLPYIPFDLDERRARLKRAYAALAPYVARWEAPRELERPDDASP